MSQADSDEETLAAQSADAASREAAAIDELLRFVASEDASLATLPTEARALAERFVALVARIASTSGRLAAIEAAARDWRADTAEAARRRSAADAASATLASRFAPALGAATFALAVRGVIDRPPALTMRFAIHDQIERFRAAQAIAEPASDAGVVQRAKAKVRQLAISGQIKVEELKIGRADAQAATALLSIDCPPTGVAATTLDAEATARGQR